MIAVITGAGLASLILPEHIDALALVGAVLVAGALLFKRRGSKATETNEGLGFNIPLTSS